MVVEVPLGDIAPGYLARDRVTLEREPLEALKASIAAHGQRTPAEITPLEPAAGGDGGDSPETRGGGTNRVSAFGLPSHPGNGFKTPSNQRAARSTTPGCVLFF